MVAETFFNFDQWWQQQASARPTPDATFQKIYPKTDGYWYALNSAGVESKFATSGGGSAFGLTSTATAAGTTTLTIASTPVQLFTGATTQNCVLPAATTLIVGWWYTIRNTSSGVVTVKDGGGSTLIALAANQEVTLYCSNVGSTAGVWSQQQVTGSGNVVLATSPTIATPTIADFTNAPHFHTNAANGGQLNAGAVFSNGQVPLARGGTNADLSATGGANQFLKQASSGGAVSVAAILSADLTTPLTTPPAIGGTTPANVTAAQLALKAIGALTISSGAVTITQSFESIAPESGSSDDLDTLSGAAAGKIVVIRPTSTNVIRVTTAGNVVTPDGAAITLSGSTQALTLIYDDGQSKWIVIGRQTLGLAGVTSRIVQVFFADTSSVIGAGKTGLVFNTAGLTCYYKRTSANAAVAVTLATMTLGTWATGGFKEVDATHMPGVYEFGVPDAALAVGDGSSSVSIEFVLSAPASAVARPLVLALS